MNGKVLKRKDYWRPAGPIRAQPDGDDEDVESGAESSNEDAVVVGNL